jgi:tripartite-type tricarboxylate transporter receptor subunit TctC
MLAKGSHWRIVAALVSLWVLAGVRAAPADEYPSRVIRIVVPTSPSTPPDIIARIVAKELTQDEGWQVIIENKPGGSQTIGAADVIRQPADGYSILAMTMPLAAAPALFPDLGLKLDSQLTPIVQASISYNALVVNPSVPAQSVSQLVGLLQQQPDKLTFSSGGFGTPAHLIGELFKLQAGVRAVHVPYQQMPQAIGDLLNGTNQYMFITILPVVELIKTGRLRALAVTGPRRVEALKEVPTVVEAGFPGLVAEDWVGFAVRSGTPPEISDKLNRAINKVLQKEEVRGSFTKVGADVVGGDAKTFGAFFASELAKWNKVVKDAGIKVAQ